MGIVQHHDAISGTERQDVADDYALRLSDGIAAAEVCQCVIALKLLFFERSTMVFLLECY